MDSSAYLCVLLAQQGWERLSRETAGATLLSSVLLVLETKRNLVRLARDGKLKSEPFTACVERVDEDTNVMVLRDLTLDLCQANRMPAILTPRTLDLVHLRTALWFHSEEPLDRFLTVDGAQQQAARELGLPV